MIRGSCHCGAVHLVVPRIPPNLTSCNCSICRRLGSLMAYYAPAEVTIEAEPDATAAYVWGDRMLAFHHCRTCGCTTHWTGLGDTREDRMGVNVRMFEPSAVEGARIRHLDGADTWNYLD